MRESVTTSRCPVRHLTLLLLAGSVACSRHRPVVRPEPAAAPATVTAPAPAVLAPREVPAAMARKSLMVPVLGVDPARVRDSYTAGRGGGRTHDAVDIMAPRGTPVVAAEDGTILKLRQNEAGGITIYQLDPGERFVYYYAHLERYQRGLTEGMRVRQGQVLGFVGTTGNAPDNLPHLHFQMMVYRGKGQYWGGDPVNPNPLFMRQGRRQ